MHDAYKNEYATQPIWHECVSMRHNPTYKRAGMQACVMHTNEYATQPIIGEGMRLRLCSRGDTAAVSPCWFLREQHGGRGARASHEQPRSIALGGGVDPSGGLVPEQICRVRGAMAVRGWAMTRCVLTASVAGLLTKRAGGPS